ncbi:putative basic proline-rich protein-like [Iris pallida]|uniref:Basic proline-rich protein-like n=1 Tax=Iris pallida TaxID=29817 RepID=A0AAX6DT37_IRIPA|nr:putative basic proline-rich protein-like [Iris pallida]
MATTPGPKSAEQRPARRPEPDVVGGDFSFSSATAQLHFSSALRHSSAEPSLVTHCRSPHLFFLHPFSVPTRFFSLHSPLEASLLS